MWTGTEFEVDICFIRHGLTKSNELHRYLSFTDEPLSQAGRERILLTASTESFPKCDALFTSSLIRTVETAKLIYGDFPLVMINDFDEIDFGDFEGFTYEELKDNILYRKWLDSNCESQIPNGEKKSDFINRQLQGLSKVLFQSRDNKQISVVCHGGTIMSIFSSFLEGDYYSYSVPNGDFMSAHICYQILENRDAKISRFSLNDRHDS